VQNLQKWRAEFSIFWRKILTTLCVSNASDQSQIDRTYRQNYNPNVL